MFSDDIYTPLDVPFQPTYLYIKQHSVTGKLYFGKTTKTDPVKYLGSGVHWLRHLQTHGRSHVITLWYCMFYEKDECVEFALMFSKMNSIVESHLWLNLVNENGLDGNAPHEVAGKNNPMYGKTHSPEARKRISAARQATGVISEATKTKMSKAKSGENNNMYGRTGEVCCFNLLTKTFCRIPKNEFHAHKGTKYVGVKSKLARI